MGLGSRSEDCCCCFGVKTGTLILLYLELVCYVGLSLAIFSSIQSGSTTTIHYRYMHEDSYTYTTQTELNGGRNESLPPLFIGCLIMLVIILAGLFSIWKKKPSLLIPYFIIRILYAVIVIAIMIILLFAEKLGLDAINKPKSYNTVIEDFSGQENSFGKALSVISNALYFLMAMEVLLIVLQIHFAKVVYACYKQIQGASNTSGGIILSAPACNIPYTTLTNPYVYDQLPNQPVPYPSIQI